MFEGQVPCFFSLAEPSCPNTARWLASFVHEESTARCEWGEPWPLCDEHKQVVQAMSHPFWRTWHQVPPTLCVKCESPLRLERLDPL